MNITQGESEATVEIDTKDISIGVYQLELESYNSLDTDNLVLFTETIDIHVGLELLDPILATIIGPCDLKRLEFNPTSE